MIRVLDLKQNTPEWDEFRKKSIGASNAAAIMRASPWKTKHDVYDEMVNGKKVFINSSMQKGMELEPVALMWCMGNLETFLSPKVVVNSSIPYAHASLDGLSNDLSIAVEIKVVGEKTHKIALDGKIPEHYQWQMVHQMAIANLPFMYYCSYFECNGELDVRMIRFDRDMDKEVTYLDELNRFWMDYFLNSNPIEEPKKATILVPGETEKAIRLQANLHTRESVKKEISMLQDILECLDKEIIEDCDGESVEIGDHKVTKYTVKGGIDYASIPELRGVDLEKYRKPSREQWRIS